MFIYFPFCSLFLSSPSIHFYHVTYVYMMVGIYYEIVHKLTKFDICLPKVTVKEIKRKTK